MTLVIVTVVTVAVVIVVIMTSFSKNSLTPQQPMRCSRAAFCNSCNVFWRNSNINESYSLHQEYLWHLKMVNFLESKFYPTKKILYYFEPCPIEGRAPAKAVNGQGRAGCLIFLNTLMCTYKVKQKPPFGRLGSWCTEYIRYVKYL